MTALTPINSDDFELLANTKNLQKHDEELQCKTFKEHERVDSTEK